MEASGNGMKFVCTLSSTVWSESLSNEAGRLSHEAVWSFLASLANLYCAGNRPLSIYLDTKWFFDWPSRLMLPYLSLMFFMSFEFYLMLDISECWPTPITSRGLEILDKEGSLSLATLDIFTFIDLAESFISWAGLSWLAKCIEFRSFCCRSKLDLMSFVANGFCWKDWTLLLTLNPRVSTLLVYAPLNCRF